VVSRLDLPPDDVAPWPSAPKRSGQPAYLSTLYSMTLPVDTTAIRLDRIERKADEASRAATVADVQSKVDADLH
jgi:hypothetical protein